MNVCFLDVDGVLNDEFTKELTPNKYVGIDDDKVALLEKVVSGTDSIIVLASDWKDNWDKDIEKCDIEAVYLNDKLAKYGLVIYDKTIDSRPELRGEGIKKWLVENEKLNIDDWFVFDDKRFDYNDINGFLEHFISCNPIRGGLGLIRTAYQDMSPATDKAIAILLDNGAVRKNRTWF